MSDPAMFTRRTAVALGSLGAAGSALALAGCTAESTAPPAPDAPEPDAPGDDLGDDATDDDARGEDGGQGDAIASVGDVPVGGAVSASIGSDRVLIAQPAAGAFVGYSAVCPHQGCVVAPAGGEFACPCHGSRFALADGEVIQGPALRGLDSVSIAVDGDSIVPG